MSDTSAIVLNKVLLERNLDVWSKLKLAFIDSAYSSVYSAISRHYDKYGEIPSFEELHLTIRENPAQNILAGLKLIDEPDISAEVALDALIDQYTQNQTVTLLDKFIDKLPIYDTAEIKENLASIVLYLDEKTLTTEGVYNMADIVLFKTQEQLDTDRVHLGLNNSFDSVLGGVARQELILIGGERGSGKSVTCSNIMINQYEAGNSCVYFTIEMIAHEVLERNLSILADTNYLAMKKGTLSNDDLVKIVKARASMFMEADDLVIDYLKHRDKFKFEHELVRTKKLKETNQMILIDDRALSISSIDLHLGKLKAKFGDNLKVAVVDYMNQVTMEGLDLFDWKSQVIISKKLKELARKHEVVITSPYQIDSTGEARFAKGILDAADIAMTMKVHGKDDQKVLEFNLTKIRSGPTMKFASSMNGDTLRISSTPVEIPSSETKEQRKAIKNHKVKEEAVDVSPDAPW
jgi:ABC-type dipeptide/oligopeptide/nickel transport system ATPase component